MGSAGVCEEMKEQGVVVGIAAGVDDDALGAGWVLAVVEADDALKEGRALTAAEGEDGEVPAAGWALTAVEQPEAASSALTHRAAGTGREGRASAMGPFFRRHLTVRPHGGAVASF
ncbi:hypothetical protein [Micrococcus luteus]|uniref:hypothetical protein n=1 Tax=Micrococcus luteus TaxID=1270 RepID=UPI0006692D2D|nr:hypothetical protein [Micrococcus luteus]